MKEYKPLRKINWAEFFFYIGLGLIGVAIVIYEGIKHGL